jgi:hypothetical protein
MTGMASVIGLGAGALGMPGLDRAGADVLAIWASVDFDLPAPGQRGVPRRREDPQPPSPAAIWWGEPGQSSLLWEAPIAFARSTTEIHVRADAWAPAGRLATEVAVGVRVGSCRQQAVVFGERRWTASLDIERPLPFDRLPLVWEHAFGGPLDPRNPIGIGRWENRSEAVGRPLPNIEDPDHRIRSFGDRPEPIGFLPRGPGWQPRLALAGTYDDAWLRDGAPLWPEDFDERFFLAAPPALVAPERLRGGEACVLSGMHPEGDLAFELPSVRIEARSRFRRREDVRELSLDIVRIDVVAGVLSLVFHASVPAHRELADHRRSVVARIDPG